MLGYERNKFPVSPSEEQRLEMLRQLHILDTPSESHFDGMVNVGKFMFKVPICLISLIDMNRQWFKSCVGLDVSETGRDEAFCAHAIMPKAPAPFVVLDAKADPRFANNPLVVGAPFIRFYAGAPLVMGDIKLGTFCCIDTKPRDEFTDEQASMLMLMAKQVTDGLESRVAARRLEKANAELHLNSAELRTVNNELNSLIDAANAPIFAVDESMKVTVWNDKIAQMTSISKADVYGRAISDLLRNTDRHRPGTPTAGGPALAAPAASSSSSSPAADVAPAAATAAAAAAAPGAGAGPSETAAVAETSSDLHRSILEMLESALSGSHVSCFDVELFSINHGRLIQLQVNAEPKLDSSGRVVGVVCVGQDVVAQKAVAKKQLENLQLKEINEAKDAFLACMSHEMRTPLNGLLGMLQMALAESEDARASVDGRALSGVERVTAIRRFITQAKNSGMLLLSLINDILDITRIETGQLSLDVAPFSLHAALDETVVMLQHKAAEKSLTLELHLDPSLEGSWFEGDVKRLQQILLNLLWNALKFTDKGGRVGLSARATARRELPGAASGGDAAGSCGDGGAADAANGGAAGAANGGAAVANGGAVVAGSGAGEGEGGGGGGGHEVDLLLQVVDTGVGMDEAMLATIFEPQSNRHLRYGNRPHHPKQHAHSDSADADVVGGAGLGVSICKQLATLMRGRLWVKSRVGHGTEVSVQLPLRETTKPTTPLVSAFDGAGGGGGVAGGGGGGSGGSGGEAHRSLQCPNG